MSIPVIRALPPQETRTAEKLWEHYLAEKELAERLRRASAGERTGLYSSVYEELFRRIPDHPQLRRKTSATQQAQHIATQLRLLRPWLKRDTTFLEIGAGDCALSFAIAKHVSHVYAVDVSETATRTKTTPRNFTLLLSDGSSIPAPAGKITLAYSNQLMEHLHPDDALAQLTNIHLSLVPGGVYVCVTPNRLTGPHDISRYFDDNATGFHLKEYTARELIRMFRNAGFRTAHQSIPTSRGFSVIPTALSALIESMCEFPPRSVRARILAQRRVDKLLEIRLVARK